MTILYKVEEIPFMDVADLETLLLVEGISDWNLVNTLPGRVDSETGEAHVICIFKKVT